MFEASEPWQLRIDDLLNACCGIIVALSATSQLASFWSVDHDDSIESLMLLGFNEKR
jgi:hypothetical protein